jgi:DNA-binding MarR family transcriptional regulator
MSKGLGILQRSILDGLRRSRNYEGLWVTELADWTDADIRATRRAVRALERRGLVTVTKYRGDGIQGSGLHVRITDAGLAHPINPIE